MTEKIKSLNRETNEALIDGNSREERIRSRIWEAVGHGNPLINSDHTFIVMGIDGFDNTMFPCGSTDSIEEARDLAKQKNMEEYLFSDRSGYEEIETDISTSFHVFNRDGFHVPIAKSVNDQEDD